MEAHQPSLANPTALALVEESLQMLMRNGRYSRLLAEELASHLSGRRFSVHSIYDELSILENPNGRSTVTAPAEPFKHPPLRGLFKKHHAQARFIMANILNHWSEKRLRVLLASLPQDEHFANRLAHELTIGAYETKAARKRVTGEWIVFATHYERNYYLTLASHKEPDALIYERARRGLSEFSELSYFYPAR